MKSGILLFMSAVMCVLEQGTCQLCYSCTPQGNTSETSADLTGCDTVQCNIYGGCSKVQVSAVSTNPQGINETVFFTYRDCGKNQNQCSPTSQASLADYSAFEIFLRARYTVKFDYGETCNCNQELCNSAISSRLSSQYLLPEMVLVAFSSSLLFWLS